MRLTFEVPDAIAHQLHLDGEDAEQRALEIFTLEGYRRGNLSRGQVSELLGKEWSETETFLKENGCGLGLTVEAFEQERGNLREFLSR